MKAQAFIRDLKHLHSVKGDELGVSDANARRIIHKLAAKLGVDHDSADEVCKSVEKPAWTNYDDGEATVILASAGVDGEQAIAAAMAEPGGALIAAFLDHADDPEQPVAKKEKGFSEMTLREKAEKLLEVDAGERVRKSGNGTTYEQAYDAASRTERGRALLKIAFDSQSDTADTASYLAQKWAQEDFVTWAAVKKYFHQPAEY